MDKQPRRAAERPSAGRIPLPIAGAPPLRTAEPLFWFGGAGREVRHGPEYFYDCRDRPDQPHGVLQLTLAGCGFHRDLRTPRRRSVPLQPGRAMLDIIPGPFAYGWAPSPDGSPYEHVYVSMVGPAALRWVRQLRGRFGPVLELGADSPVAPHMLDIVARHAEGRLEDRYLVSSLLYQLLMQVLSTLTRGRIAASPLAESAMRLLRRHAPDPAYNIQALASQLGCTREHLSRLFRSVARVSPSNFLLQQRLELATRDLRDSDDKLAAIARRSGFASASYFCRVFRSRFRVTPDHFRRNPWTIVR